MAEECIFCKIAAGEIPAYVVYEDGKTMAFLDIFPVHPGHVLVIPKRHSVDVFDTDEETMKSMIAVAKKLCPAVLKGTGADGINLGMNNRPAAGQEVMHAHLHVIPRYKDDGLKWWRKNPFKSDGQKKQVCDNIKKEM